MLLAELTIRHTRRHMPTRRVALDPGIYLPMTGAAHGALLLEAVVAEHLPGLEEEQLELLPRLLDDARDHLSVPRLALRHRLQVDTHGLDRSRHRVLGEHGLVVVELDVHGAAAPQVLGAVMAAAALPTSARGIALDAIRRAVAGRSRFPAGLVTRRVSELPTGERPPLPGAPWQPGAPAEEEPWRGVPADLRWALQVLDLRPGPDLDRDAVNRHFRRLVREAHPDHGGQQHGAAERIAELTEAREILLAVAVEPAVEGDAAAPAG